LDPESKDRQSAQCVCSHFEIHLVFNADRLLPGEDRFKDFSERLKKDPGLPHANPTKSYWQEPEHESIATIQSPQLPSETDILIIGSGITGCSIAKQLLETDSSVKVTILEARSICSGATGRNGGNIKAVPELTTQAVGVEASREIVKFTLANVEALMKLNETLPADLQKNGEVRRVETMNVFTTEETFQNFQNAVKVFDDGFPEFRGRGRLVDAGELRSVSPLGRMSMNIGTDGKVEARYTPRSRSISSIGRCSVAISFDHGNLCRAVEDVW
jgi:hypothetical protein